MSSHSAQAIRQRSVEDLLPCASNARTHSSAQVEQLARSITEFGFTNPVLVDTDGTIIAGHGRVLAARQLGLASVPTIDVHWLSEAQRRAYILADNQLALNAGWDEALLSQEMAALKGLGFDLSLVGFSNERLDALVAGVTDSEESKDPEAAPARRQTPHSQLGDLWTLGPHRVLCGDCTRAEDLTRLMNGQLADCVWTDPPYNVDYEGGTPEALKIQNDSMDAAAFRTFLHDALRSLETAMKPGASIYVAHSDKEALSFLTAFSAAGFKQHGCVIWKKDQLVLGRMDYQPMHEPILYGWKPGKAHRWYGGRKQTTIAELGEDVGFRQLDDGRWQIAVGDNVLIVSGAAEVEALVPSVVFYAKPRRSNLHPTMKPVALIEKMLRNSALPGDIVLDGFGGSGSTLVAAHRQGMSARLCELDPVYCDVIVRRWQDYCGQRAIHAETGKAFPT